MYEAVMLANFLVWLVMVVVFLRRPCASIYHPFLFYLAFHFIVFTIRAPLVYFRGYDFIYRIYDFQPTELEKTTALLVAMLGLVTFGVTSMYFGRTAVSFDRPAGEEAERARLRRPLLWTAALLAPIAIYSMLTAWTEGITGQTSMVRDAVTRIAINTTSNGYFYESRLMLGPICLLFAWITRFRWYSFLPLIAFLILGGGTGTRGPFMLAGVGIGLLWMYQRHNRWPTLPTLALFAALAVFFTNVGVDRGQGVREMFVEEQVERDNTYYADLRFMEGMDAGNLEYLEFLVYAIPNKTGTHGYFADLLQVFTEPIPRALWPNKPIGAPIQMYNLFQYGNPAGMTSSMPGQGWANLGFPGVLLWCGLFGAFWGWFYEQFARQPTTNLRLLVYMTFVPLSILFFRDGGPITMLRFGLFLAIPLLVFSLLVWLSRWESRQATLAAVPAMSGAERRAQRAAGSAPAGPSTGRDNRRRLAGGMPES